jgi:hypothetical protein
MASGRVAAGRPDGEYAFVAGLYVAALLAPALVLLLASVRSDAAVLYVGFLLAVAGVTAVAGWVVSRVPGLAIRLGRRDAVWLLVVPPAGSPARSAPTPSTSICPASRCRWRSSARPAGCCSDCCWWR